MGSEVFILSISIERNIKLNSVIRKINDELQEFCKEYNFNYISNDEIGRSLLCDDGVYLSDNGMDILVSNFVNNLNSTYLEDFLTQEISIDKRLSITNKKRL